MKYKDIPWLIRVAIWVAALTTLAPVIVILTIVAIAAINS